MSTQNILTVFYQATSQEISEGRIWYDKALEFINDLSERYNVDRTLVAVVLSSLSPRNRWERNLSDTENLIKAVYYHDVEYAYENVKVATYNAHKRRALDYLSGVKSLDGYFDLNKNSGLKTASFAANILGNHELVTIDVHATSIWLGHRVLKSAPYNLTPKRYRTISSDYIKCAEKVGNVTPAQLQSICWVVWKRIHNI